MVKEGSVSWVILYFKFVNLISYYLLIIIYIIKY